MRRARRRARRADWGGALLIAAGLGVLGALAGAAMLLRPPPIDPETLCRTDRPLSAHTLILVDATDRLEPRHRRALQLLVAQERARLAPYDRLTILALNVRRPQEPRRLFALCLPRSGADANPLFENPRQSQAAWDETVGAALKAALRRASAGGGADASPIIASVRAAARDPDFAQSAATRRFVLVSDLLEHEPDGFTLYREGADFASWRDGGSVAPPDLTNISVRVSLIDRPEHEASQAHAREAFWGPFFDASGASDIAFD